MTTRSSIMQRAAEATIVSLTVVACSSSPSAPREVTEDGPSVGGATRGNTTTRDTTTNGSATAASNAEDDTNSAGGATSTTGAAPSGGKTAWQSSSKASSAGSTRGGASSEISRATGGIAAAGGTTTTGKAAGGTGGKVADSSAAGGKAAGGAATGGKSTGGAATGGASGTISSTPSDDPLPSSGCSATPAATSCNTQSSPCRLNVGGTDRTFYVQLPDSYDAKRPYPVVFEYHPLGGNGWQGLTMYRIRPNFPDAIYVSASGGNQGFANTNGQDEAMTRAIMENIEAKYCIDKARYYATGFSYGGSMSFTAGCNMSDVFRAIGAMAGAPISGATCASKKPARPVAVWATHGDADTALPITMAQPMIDAIVGYNGCSTTTQPVDPSPCVAYQSCMDGYPVVWCPRPGDPHAIPNFAAAAIADFFKQF